MKKLQANCYLENLENKSEKKTAAVFIKSDKKIETLLEQGYACTAAKQNGAFNIWRDDNGRLRGNLFKFCNLIEGREFKDLSETKEYVNKWLKSIK
jgi:hypothetical protein